MNRSLTRMSAGAARFAVVLLLAAPASAPQSVAQAKGLIPVTVASTPDDTFVAVI